MTLALEIVTPDRLIESRDVEMVTIPAEDGDMGALEGHAPMIVMLRGGVVSVHDGDRVSDQWFITGGIAEITTTRCTVLAEYAIRSADLDREEAARLLRDAEDAYGALETPEPEEERAARERVDAIRAMTETMGGAA